VTELAVFAKKIVILRISDRDRSLFSMRAYNAVNNESPRFTGPPAPNGSCIYLPYIYFAAYIGFARVEIKCCSHCASSSLRDHWLENLLVLLKSTEQRVSVVIRYTMRYLCQVRAASSKIYRSGYDPAERGFLDRRSTQWTLV